MNVSTPRWKAWLAGAASLAAVWLLCFRHRTLTTTEEGGAVETDQKCRIRLVETIPEGMAFNRTAVAAAIDTYDAWLELISLAKDEVEIASPYWTLRSDDGGGSDPTDWKGQDVFRRLWNMAETGGVRLRIAQDSRTKEKNRDTRELETLNGVQVTTLTFHHLVGDGLLHTKLLMVDRRHFYVGSANFDWRSLAQVKEMGILVTDCPTLGQDAGKIFDVYWVLGGHGKVVPDHWPARLETRINPDAPLVIDGDRSSLSVYLSSSPPQLCPKGRVSDIDAILNVINNAEEFIYVAVMDYYPITIYARYTKFWPLIDDALKKAAIERSVEVRMLLSNWTQTRAKMRSFLESLTSLNRIQGKFFTVPANSRQAKIPFARVNHNKYVVTEKEAIVGTSNWSADYFINSGGIGFRLSSSSKGGQRQKTSVHKHLLEIYNRDWESQYSSDIL